MSESGKQNRKTEAMPNRLLLEKYEELKKIPLLA